MSFDVYTLGVEEWRWWFNHRLGGSLARYAERVLSLFGAELKDAGSCFQGRKGRARVHVADVDVYADRDYVTGLLAHASRQSVKTLYILAREFDSRLREWLVEFKREFGATVHPVPIMREVMEVNRHKIPTWYELADLDAGWWLVEGTNEARIAVNRFRPRILDDSPKMKAVKTRASRKGVDFIDYWAVDLNWKGRGSPFNLCWGAYRTRKSRKEGEPLELSTPWFVRPKEDRQVKVMVVDVFGIEHYAAFLMHA